jgi:hypothetical protein
MNASMMTFSKYTAPRCEFDLRWEPAGLLANSDLTDEGPGEFLIDGGEYDF